MGNNKGALTKAGIIFPILIVLVLVSATGAFLFGNSKIKNTVSDNTLEIVSDNNISENLVSENALNKPEHQEPLPKGPRLSCEDYKEMYDRSEYTAQIVAAEITKKKQAEEEQRRLEEEASRMQAEKDALEALSQNQPEPEAPVVPVPETPVVPPAPVGDGSFNFLWDVTGVPGQPYLVAVNRSMNAVTVYGLDENAMYTVPVKVFVCSVGREGHSTPAGRYTTLERYDWRLMVDNTWARYAIRIYKGIMFHSVGYFQKAADTLEYDEYNKLGSPASLGCIRMRVTDIYWLYANCPTGFTAVIYDDPTCPGPLGKPTAQIIDTTDELRRNWDPTDPDPNSPWNY